MSFCSNIRIAIYAESEEALRIRFDKTPKESNPEFNAERVGNRFMMSWDEKPRLEPPRRTVQQEQRIWAAGGFLSPITGSRE